MRISRLVQVTAASLLLAFGTPAGAAEPTIDELLDATDDIARGVSSRAVITMNVTTDRYQRTVKMEALSRGEEDSLVRILEPAKEKGVATLKVGDNIWNYLPKVDRTMKLPASMMSGSWMGSHITNDDLVKSNRLADEFTATMVDQPSAGSTDPSALYVIELVPRDDAAVVWGKIVVRVRADLVPRDISYFDEKGARVRVMSFEDIQQISGRAVPMTMRVVPDDRPGESTVITYDALEFDVELPDSTFTLQALRQ